MASSRSKIRRSVVVVVVAGGMVLAPGIGLAATPPGPVDEALAAVGQSDRSDEVEEHQKPLLELATHDRKGSYYTLDPEHAQRAQDEYGFVPKSDSEGITMFDAELDGTKPVWRLRMKNGHQSYLLSVSQKEIDQLGDRFEVEGIIGYIYEGPVQGSMPLVRYAKDSDWRVSREGRDDLVEAGYEVDGTMGFVPEG